MKPSIPQGTRDFSPTVVRRRQYIFDVLRTIFERYGYMPIETPALELLQTLTGKYGEEGDRLIFKILNNGLHETIPEKKEQLKDDFATLLNKSSALSSITERALRYDLTIPFARYVVMNQNEIAFPFKRYQMQPVWRADRPQRGRYREFWQCDCDVVGSNSLINEAELLGIYADAFQQLKVPGVTLKINSRKILSGLAAFCGHADKMMPITVAIDKLDKIGWEGVSAELSRVGITTEGIEKLKAIMTLSGNNDKLLEQLQHQLGAIPEAMNGIEEVKRTLHFYHLLKDATNEVEVKLDVALARGLNYYTGIIIEVVTNAVKMGSIGGGGRYDDLTGLFGLKNLSGVGVSFGIDRIYDVMEELSLFAEDSRAGSKVLLLNMGVPTEAYSIKVLSALRANGIASEFYPDAVKFDKQMKYANKRGFEYIILLGEEEQAQQKVSLKNFTTGQQEMLSLEDAVAMLKQGQR